MSLLETVSGLALRFLKEEHYLDLSSGYRRARTRLFPVMRALYGTFDAAQLRDHLEQRIGRDFEVLMVHSSIDHMKPMYTGNPLELVRMLIDYCGAGRTLAMPAFYFGDPAIGGAYATFKERPRFDLRRTPSQMGLATELFRRTKGVVQSRNPAYRVAALGPLAADLVRGHEHAASPCGPGTPFEFMAKRDTLVIGIGKPFQVLTQVHHAEEVMGDAFPVPERRGAPLAMTLVDGDEEIPYTLSGRVMEWRFNIWKLRDMMDRERLREWTFHHVPMFAARAGEVTSAVIDAARRGVTLYDRP